MKITADTNVLVRALVRDDALQARAAAIALDKAMLIAISLPCLCELVWVLRKVYHFKVDDVAAAISALVDTPKVIMNRPAVDAGLAILKAGGDFADGIMAYEGQWLGGETFLSFDKKAVALLAANGQAAVLL